MRRNGESDNNNINDRTDNCNINDRTDTNDDDAAVDDFATLPGLIDFNG
jgi:hypothetical protein